LCFYWVKHWQQRNWRTGEFAANPGAVQFGQELRDRRRFRCAMHWHGDPPEAIRALVQIRLHKAATDRVHGPLLYWDGHSANRRTSSLFAEEQPPEASYSYTDQWKQSTGLICHANSSSTVDKKLQNPCLYRQINYDKQSNKQKKYKLLQIWL